MKIFIANICLVLFAVVLAAGTPAASSHASEALHIVVTDVRARPAAMVGGNGAGYFKVENTGDTADTLLEIKADICKKVELHSMTMDGFVMKMRQLEDVPLPAHGMVEFKKGGNHIMFIGLKASLKTGDTFPVTFLFKQAGPITVDMTVR